MPMAAAVYEEKHKWALPELDWESWEAQSIAWASKYSSAKAVGAKAMKSTVLDGAGRDNLRAIARLEDELHLAHSGTRRVVLANFPPAEVRRLRKP